MKIHIISKIPRSFRVTAVYYSAVGICIGCLFPILATIIDTGRHALDQSFANWILVQASDPLHWIIDLTPVFLGLFAWLIGKRTDRLLQANRSLNLNIIELTRAEDEIRRRNDLLKSTIESLTHPFYVIDTDSYTIRLANSAANFGNLDENSKCYALTHKRPAPCDSAAHGCLLQMVKKAKKPVMTEHIHYDKSGKPRCFEVHGYPIFDARGEVSQIIEYSLDITERRQAEEALKKSEEKFRRVIETLPVVIWSRKADTGEILILSPAAERLTGYSADELKTDPACLRSVIHPDDWERLQSHMNKMTAGSEPQSFEVRLFHRRGTIKIASVLLSPSFNAEGVLDCIDGVAIDITDKKLLEDQVIQSEKMAAIGVLAAGVAHEFNNLLGAIMGNLSFVENHRGDSDVCLKSIKEALVATNRAAEVIQSLLSYSKQRDNHKTEVKVVELIEDILKLVGKEIKNKNIRLFKNLHEVPGVHCVPGQLQQVFLNILINATHAVEQGGVISISTWSGNDQVYIEFADNGIGMEKHVLNKIFDPFFSTKGVWGENRHGGTGLGLSISHNIIKSNGGDILVRSAPNIGTEFMIVLPSGPTEKIIRENLVFIENKRALAVEFDAEQGEALARIIREFGGKPTITTWGDEALRHFNKEHFDFIILDASHPAMADFVRLFENIRKSEPSLPVLLSSFGPIRYQYDEYVYQSQGIIFKPFTSQNVAYVLAKLNQAKAGGPIRVG